jgi:endonuclease III-like uncharacterized protein
MTPRTLLRDAVRGFSRWLMAPSAAETAAKRIAELERGAGFYEQRLETLRGVAEHIQVRLHNERRKKADA